MHPLDRAHLILTTERLKPASTFRGHDNIEKILKKTTLYYVLTKTHNGFVCDATYDENIYEQFVKMRNRSVQENKIEAEEWKIKADHEYFGSIYGYPECCIEAYTTNMRNGIGIKRLKELDNVPQKLYCLFHIPCSSNCVESLELAKRYRLVLEKTDQEAVVALEKFNKS